MTAIYRRTILSAVIATAILSVLRAQNSGYNYIRTQTMLNEQGSSYMNEIQYFDELGRPSLHASNGVGMDGKYVFTLTTYNEAGLKRNEYRPVVGSASGSAYYDASSMQSRAQSTYGDPYAYSYARYDILGRPVSMLEPGQAWHSANKSVRKTYDTNAANSVKHYRAPVNANSQVVQDGFYAAGALHMERTTDEDGHTVQVFTDRMNRKVLERRADDNDTYFVYNTQGQLRFVLSPDYQQTASLELSAYEYRYDGRGRIIRKTLPQCDYIQYWYDRADRLLFMQDARLRQKGLYRFTLYDKVGRLAVQGTCSSGNFSGSFDATVTYNQGSNSLPGTNYVPTTSGVVTAPVIESANYYDDYRFLGDGLFSASGQAAALTLANPQNARGLLTGHIVSTTEGDMLYEVTYYDAKGQVTDHRRTLPGGRLLTEQSTLSFTGQPLTVSQCLSMGSTVTTVVLTNTYNPYNNRLASTSLNYGLGAVTVASYVYDGVGRLVAVRHGGSGGETDYSYNVRGWTTNILGPGFRENLYYTDGPGTPCYNGNISAQTYKAGKDTNYRGYLFSYDALNRLTTASYGEQSSLTQNTGHYSEQITGYSPNSAITGLKRYGKIQDGTYGIIDDLSMTLSGNRPVAISDAATPVLTSNTFNFTDNTVSTSGSEYTYDGCGAMTRDTNKGITSVSYDNSGMPQKVSFSTSSYTRYNYSADGEKLKCMHYTHPYGHQPLPLDTIGPVIGPHPGLHSLGNTASLNGKVIEPGIHYYSFCDSTEYLGNFILTNGKQDKYLFAGGYLTASQSGAVFHYYTPDHLGNNRAVIKQDGTIEQVTHYYPFGGIIYDLSTNPNVQQYKYNGKEYERMHGLNWYDYGARHYDAAIGSWPTVDPLAEKYYSLSPYNYCGGNPIRFIDPDGKAVYLYATTLPGASWTPFATHTFLVVTNNDGSLRNYYAYGSENEGLKGVFGGRLMRQYYSQDIDIIYGNDTENVKRIIPIDHPSNMSSEEFDQNVINVAESFGNNPDITYCINPLSDTTGNCNSSTSTILLKAGITKEGIERIKENIPGICWGFSSEEKPWTSEEQQKVINN